MNLQNSSLYNFLSLTHEGQISFAGQHHSCLLLIVKDSLGFAELSIFGCQNLFDKWTLNSHFQRYQDEKIIKLIKEIISLLNYFTAIIKAKIYLYFVFHSATINVFRIYATSEIRYTKRLPIQTNIVSASA